MSKKYYAENDSKSESTISSLISYIDGSYDAEKNIYGSGIVIIENGKEKIFYFAGNNKSYALSRNVAGEISAAIMLWNMLKKTGIKNLR